MTGQSGGGGLQPSQTVAGVLNGSLLAPTFATNGTDALFSVRSALLGGTVNMTNANQFYDGPTIALTAGSWLVSATVTLSTPTSGVAPTLRLWDGTTVYVSTGATNPGAGSETTLTVSYPIVLAGSATIRASVACALAGQAIVTATLANPAGNNASSIWAMRYA